MVKRLTPSVLRPQVNVPVDPEAFLVRKSRMPSPVAEAGVNEGLKTFEVVERDVFGPAVGPPVPLGVVGYEADLVVSADGPSHVPHDEADEKFPVAVLMKFAIV